MIFENRLEPCWPAEEVKTAPRTAREKKNPRICEGERLNSGNPRPRPQRRIQKNYGLMTLPLFEIALVFVRFDHVARIIVNANHSIM